MVPGNILSLQIKCSWEYEVLGNMDLCESKHDGKGNITSSASRRADGESPSSPLGCAAAITQLLDQTQAPPAHQRHEAQAWGTGHLQERAHSFRKHQGFQKAKSGAADHPWMDEQVAHLWACVSTGIWKGLQSPAP